MKPKRNDDIETRLLPDGHVVLFSKNSDWAHTITPMAAIVWEFCDGDNTPEQIAQRTREITQSSDAELASQIDKLLQEFEQSGLILFESRE